MQATKRSTKATENRQKSCKARNRRKSSRKGGRSQRSRKGKSAKRNTKVDPRKTADTTKVASNLKTRKLNAVRVMDSRDGKIPPSKAECNFDIYDVVSNDRVTFNSSFCPKTNSVLFSSQ